MLIQNTSDKQIRLCLGKHISSRKCHVLRLDCRPQHGKTTVKSWGVFSPLHTFLWDINTVKDLACPATIWCFPCLSQQMTKFPRGPWPLNVTQSSPFSSYPLRSLHPLRRKVHLLFLSCSMWRVQELACLHLRGNCSTCCKACRILNMTVFFIAGTVMDFY